MGLVKIAPARVTEIFIAEEPIGHVASVYLSDDKKIREGVTAYQERGAGAVIGEVASGKIARVVTHGIVSGLICVAAVSLGDRVTIANASGHGTLSGLVSGHGMITSLNTITPVGSVTAASGIISLVSGFITLASGALPGTSGLYSGFIGIDGATLFGHGGLISGVTGFTGAAPVFSGSVPTFTGTAFNTARVLGKALESGGIGSGIRVLITLGG